MIENLPEMMSMFLPTEWGKAALLLAFFSTLVVIALFAYLDHYTRKAYFRYWIVAWICYAIWLGAGIAMEETAKMPDLVMLRRASIGLSALFMFWGSHQLRHRHRNQRELAAGVVLMLIWSYVAVYRVGDQLWITLPVFILLGVAGIYTGSQFLRYRARYRAALILGIGFTLWSTLLMVLPLEGILSRSAMAAAHFASATVAGFIAMGMITFALERARRRSDDLAIVYRRGIAARRSLTREVAASEEKYRALFDSASEAILIVDLETLDILEANKASEYFIEPRCEGQPSRSLADLCPSLAGKPNSLLETKRMVDDLFRASNEFTITRPNGMAVLCEGSSSMVEYSKRPALQISIREITERKKLEQQFRQTEKLSALGRLIAGVAHELNNPLAVITGFAQMLARQNNGNGQGKEECMTILRESERAAKIVRNLLTLARPRDPQMVPVDLNQLVTEAVGAQQTAVFSAQVEIHLSLEPNLPKTMADPHQIEQVLTNLLINSIQATSSQNGPRRIEVSTEKNCTNLYITVADTGPGIAPEVLGKIFDPFFTTKAPGQGTGLGLAISHSIIEEHRGRISVKTEVGRGATFRVELPILACYATAPAPSLFLPRMERLPDAQLHRLLIVDDEPGIVEVLSAVLGDGGYRIESATNGREAMERIRYQNYDLIISDLCMPGMSGESLYKTLVQTNPAQARRIIFLTGDTVSSQSRGFLESTGNRWLSKPFNIAEIEEVVGNFLKRAPAAAAYHS
jgi:PAS domain S-box-containing protein